jgi:hypothetical protein
MNAITIIQPFASLFFLPREHSAWKGVENRTWAPPASAVGRLIVIHAGKATGYGGRPVAEIAQQYGVAEMPMPTGALLGVGRLVGCCRYAPLPCGDWWAARLSGELPEWVATHAHTQGPFCWIIEEATAFARPLPMRGQQGIWQADHALVEQGLGRALASCPQCLDPQVWPRKCRLCGAEPAAGYAQSVIDAARAKMRPRRGRHR